MHGRISGFVWFYNNTIAFAVSIFDYRCFATCLKEETFKMNKQKLVIVSCIVLILVFATGALLYQNQQSEKQESLARESTSLFVREYSQTLGRNDAKVIIVEFFDPACETCASFYPLVKNQTCSKVCPFS